MTISIPVSNKGYEDINPVDAGYESCAPGKSFGPSVRNYYLIHYIENGEGTFNARGETHKVKKGEIFIIRPGETTIYTADKKNPWNYIWIGFTGRLAKSFGALDAVLSCGGSPFLKIKGLAPETKNKEEYLCARVFDIYCSLFEDISSGSSYELQAKNFIETNYMRDITVEDIARSLGLNRSYLSRIFKNKTGKSLREYLVETRLENAARFLKEGRSVKESAALCGYRDVFNFSKMFKKHFGISPKYY